MGTNEILDEPRKKPLPEQTASGATGSMERESVTDFAELRDTAVQGPNRTRSLEEYPTEVLEAVLRILRAQQKRNDSV